MNQASWNDNGESQPRMRLASLSEIQSLPASPAVAGKLLAVMTDEDADFRNPDGHGNVGPGSRIHENRPCRP